jgi:predicted small lipoprotein YifL
MKAPLRILGTALLLALSACGQKGPLVLPPQQPNAQTSVPPAPPRTDPLNRPGARTPPDVPATGEPR